MKIILVSTFTMGAYSHVVMAIMKKMGHAVYPFDQRTLRQRGLNPHVIGKAFHNLCEGVEPDVIFAIKGRGLHPDYIKDQAGLKVVWWLDNTTRFVDFQDYIDVYDKYYVIEEGQGHPWMPIGIDPTLHRPFPPDTPEQSSDVVFAGTAHPKRSARIGEILRRLPCAVALWGNNWPPGFPYQRGEAIYWRELMKVYTGSKIILNNHYYPGITPNMRSIEAPASGTMMLSDTGVGLETCLKKGKEYVAYESVKEARYLIAKYLEDVPAREKIAKAGYRRVHKDHLLIDKLEVMISE